MEPRENLSCSIHLQSGCFASGVRSDGRVFNRIESEGDCDHGGLKERKRYRNENKKAARGSEHNVWACVYAET